MDDHLDYARNVMFVERISKPNGQKTEHLIFLFLVKDMNISEMKLPNKMLNIYFDTLRAKQNTP